MLMDNCWILDHVCCFSNKTFRWFKYVCIKKLTWKSCWCWSTVGSWIISVIFLCKTFRWFVCIKKLTCKMPARVHSLTEMSWDRNDQDRKVPWPKRLRPKRPDRIGQTESARRNVLFRLRCTHLSPCHVFVVCLSEITSELSTNLQRKRPIPNDT